MRNYYSKNFILMSLSLVLCFTVLGASFIALGRNVTIAERRKTIEGNAQELAHLASAYAMDGSLADWELRISLSSLAHATGQHCFVSDPEGLVISCSDTEFACSHLGRRLDSRIFTQLSAQDTYSTLGTLGGFYQESRYISVQAVLTSQGSIAGYVFVSTDATAMIQIWHRLMNIFLVTSFLILGITLIISFLSARSLARPVNEMSAAAEKIAHGNFSARVSAEGEDELAALGTTFNNMAASLEQSERRRSEFLANVAHELKTPMTSISGFADGILDGTIPPESQKQYLETISSETKRLNRLVRRMLDASRIQQSDPEELRKNSFDAVELLLQTLLVFEQKITAKHLDVNVEVPEDSIRVLGDADAINQVIYNLTENAVKFAPESSELGISIFKQGGKAYISVKNHGETIPEKELKLIFDRFHKTDKSRSMDRDGVGLGLYIVKSILNNHGEDIAVTSRGGVTEFVFSLTLAGK